jgi:two-component system CheB/CheR fusion protein
MNQRSKKRNSTRKKNNNNNHGGSRASARTLRSDLDSEVRDEKAGAAPAPDRSVAQTKAPEPEAAAAAAAFPVVAIGGSAGAVEALRRFFRAMPSDRRIAFVVVVHLDPNHVSYMSELLAASTRMKVSEIRDGEKVEPGHVYVIPPNRFVRIAGGALRLDEATPRPIIPMPIDYFLRSLAEDQQERSVCIIITGTDRDGAQGAKEIKAGGGMVMVQTPQSAEQPGMPRNAINTGVVDYVLPIEEMPGALVSFLEHAGIEGARAEKPAEEHDTDHVGKILTLLKVRANHDFRYYKLGMIARRIRRRMGLTHIGSIQDYQRMLRESPEELQALREDLLIGVTEFFREPETWRVLEEQVVPKLVKDRKNDLPIRVWVPGCATGEEAYSVAIVLLEALGSHETGAEVNVFASDVSKLSLEIARVGKYPASIASSVSPERLQRFFMKTGDGYQVKNALRKLVLFAPHNLITDPPFSRLDLITCRNLLIYLDSQVQKKVVDLFHFALKPGGYLFLGKSESTGSSTLFQPVIKTSRIFQSAPSTRHMPVELPLAPETHLSVFGTRLPSAWKQEARLEHDHRELIRSLLLERHAPAAVLVDRNYSTMYFHGDTGDFLTQPGGEPTADLVSMVREPLRMKLRAALHNAVETEKPQAFEVRLGRKASMRVDVAPLPDFRASGFMLVTFGKSGHAKVPVPPAPKGTDHSRAIDQMEEELERTRRELQGAIQELESANEELKVSNEEAMSMNEELQSTNEELETSKEELQSLNEELTSVNNQLEEKVSELEQANDDLNNLLSSTNIATLFLRDNMHIKRFTPATTRLFNLIPADVNRPITDIANRIEDNTLVEDAKHALESQGAVEKEVRTDTDEWYLRRIMPYRTQEERVEGVVVTFTDITEHRRTTEGMRRLATVVRDANDAVTVTDLNGKIIAWNRGAERMYGYSESEALHLNIEQLVPEGARAAHRELLERARRGEYLPPAETHRLAKDGRLLEISLTASVLPDEAGRPAALAATERDVTERNRFERAVRESEARFKLLADSAPVLIRVDSVNGKTEFVNHVCIEFTGRPQESLLGDGWTPLLHPNDQATYVSAFRDAFKRRERFETDFRLRRADGEYRWMKSVSVPRYDDTGTFLGYIGCCFDIHDRKLTEQALAEADRRKDEFLAMLAHELRNPLAPISNAARLIQLIGTAEPRVQWARDVIDRQVGHLARLIEDLLDVSRITGGRLELHKDVVQLKNVVEQGAEASRPLIEARRQKFEVELPPEPLYVDGDLVRLAQVITNLLNNAAKFTNEGGEIRLKVERDNGAAVIRVTDNGIGIGPDLLPHVFDLFVQGDSSLARSRGGLGIGLTLVRRLVEMHGGKAEARSAGLNQGSEFIVRLPLVSEVAVDEAGSSQAARASKPERLRIVIVDDNVDSAESMAALLRLEGHEVKTAYDGDSMLKAAEEMKPEVVMLDIGLPGMDGYELARRLRQRPQTKSALIVAVTGYGRNEDVQKAMEAGIDCHLVKPINREGLNAILVSARDESTRGRTGGGEA